MRNKIILRSVLLLFWLGVIFAFSSSNGEESLEQSDEVIIKVVDVVKSDATKEEKEVIVEDYTFIVRKCAHFFEYLVLGVLTYNLFVLICKKKLILICLIFCFSYATSDEFHQYYVSERDGNIKDVLIDTTGSFMGILSYNLCYKKKRV